MSTYYNEFDPQAAAWLRELIKQGRLPDGEVDERDINEVQVDEIRGFTQYHFFAGIGGWAYALLLAGWSDDRPVLTGSPPCQPFSTAGKGLGVRDERHLAPKFLGLVAALRPAWVFGEQVAAAVTKDAWLDDLLDALEGAGYSTGAAVAPACSVGAPHIRQRLWFVAQSLDDPAGARHDGTQPWAEADAWDETRLCMPSAGCGASRLADSDYPGSQRRTRVSERTGECPSGEAGMDGRLANASVERRQQDPRSAPRHEATDGGEGRNRGKAQDDHIAASDEQVYRHGPADASAAGWYDPDWLLCRDGKWRPVESGTFPLADGIPARVGRLRGYGNAIVPQVAAEIIKSVM